MITKEKLTEWMEELDASIEYISLDSEEYFEEEVKTVFCFALQDAIEALEHCKLYLKGG